LIADVFFVAAMLDGGAGLGDFFAADAGLGVEGAPEAEKDVVDEPPDRWVDVC